MVDIKVLNVDIGGRSYNKDKSGYPLLPTVFSGVEIVWGAPSCIEHPDPTRATLSLWVPKTHEEFVPALGEFVTVRGGTVIPNDGGTYSNPLFTGRVEDVKLQDDHKPAPTPESTRINRAANPVPGNANGWGTTSAYVQSYETNRQGRPAMVYTKSGDSYWVTYGRRAGSPGSGTDSAAPTNGSEVMPVTAGQTVYAQMDLGTDKAGTDGRMGIRFFNSSYASVGFTETPVVDMALNTWQTFTHEAVAPAGAVYYWIEWGVAMKSGSASNGAKSWAGRVYASTDAGTYFSGDTSDTGTTVNKWSGTVNASTSIQSVYASDRATGGYRINVVAADALADAARLRLADSMWPFESVNARLRRIADLAAVNGVFFAENSTDGGAFAEALNTDVKARDVDSFPALEAFQRATMAAGTPAISVAGVVRPMTNLNLPQVLLADESNATVTYDWLGLSDRSASVQKTNGVVTRTNHAKNSIGRYGVAPEWTAVAGTGGTATIGSYEPVQNAYILSLGAVWYASPSSGVAGVSYKDTSISGVVNSKLSVGIRLKTNYTAGRSVKLRINLFKSGAVVTTGLGTAQSVPSGRFSYLKYENFTATAAYDAVEVIAEIQGTPLVGEALYASGVIIEKATTAPSFFNGSFVDNEADILPSETSTVASISAAEIVDNSFQLNTSRVVNEIKVEMKRFVGSVGEPGWEASDAANQQFDQVFTDEAGSRKTTPQTRSIATDWAVRDAFMDDELPTSTMVLKGKLLIAGQSKPQWLFTNSLSILPSQVPDSEVEPFNNLMQERTRFGALIHVTDAPSRIPNYMRVHAGRLVLGESTSLELSVEPVEYSAPLPLTTATLRTETVAAYYKIGSFKTLTSNDLRSIGAR